MTPLALAAGILAGGCETLGYYAQSARGHLHLLAARQPFDVVAQDASAPQAVRERIAYSAAARAFAVRALALPDNGSYRSYADIGRRYVAWSVVATPELSLSPRTWCFPVAGCVAYRGYFEEAEALRFAESLRAAGNDVYVAGVAAYSTLGWFDDPLPSPVIRWPEADLAGLIFHELAHQRLYVRDDTAFNEAFAVTVEQEGVARWLAERADPLAFARYQESQRRRGEFLHLVFDVRGRLAELYGSGAAPAEMRSRKAALFQEFLDRCRALVAAIAEEPRYRSWCEAPASNARIVAVTTYHELVPGFRALLDAQGGDLAAFYQAAEALAEHPPAERRRVLEEVRLGSARRGPAGAAPAGPRLPGRDERLDNALAQGQDGSPQVSQVPAAGPERRP